MNIALVHDWLIHMRGGEKVLEALAEMYPEAVLYTLFCDREKLSPVLRDRTIRVSFFQSLPGIRKYYRWLLPLMPLAIRSLKVKDADTVISTSHCVAKGIRVPPGARHLCYCHTPMRYVWEFGDVYFDRYPAWLRFLMTPVLKWLRSWDRATSRGVDVFIANSNNVRERIRRYYDRRAEVVYPPLDSTFYHRVPAGGDYYLVVSAFVPYKRVDLVIEAFNGLDRELRIVGAGPLDREYRRLRRSQRIFFLGPQTDAQLRELYSGARAVIFPTDEDLGIVPLEAQSCGTPVIALERGGALETVKTGTFFNEQSPEAIRKAIWAFESQNWDTAQLREAMRVFDKEQFKQHIVRHIKRLHQSSPSCS